MLILDVKIIIDWDDYTPGSIGQVVDFYRQYLEPEFPDVYSLKRYVKLKESQEIVAVQLTSGIYIPVEAPKKFAEMPTFPDGPKDVDAMEWQINYAIVDDTNISEEDEKELPQINTKKMEEAFQHLRLTFSNWLNSTPEGGEMRDTLKDLLSDREIPLYEKRKRMEIIMGSTIEQWITDKNEDAEFRPSILRVDCTKRTSKEECSGSCAWLSTNTREQCLIHASSSENPETRKPVPGARVLLRRLIEELIRFTIKRREIFMKNISRVSILDEPVREGDQYIVPEKSAAWAELLRSEWSTINPETPKFLEEMRKEPLEARLAPLADNTALPEGAKNLFGLDDPKTARLRIFTSPTGTLAGIFSTLKMNADELGDDLALTDTTLATIVRQGKFPAIQYDLREDPPKIIGNQLLVDMGKGYAVFVIQEKPSLVVVDPSKPSLLKKAELPAKLLKKITDLKKIFGATAR
jgi:hypothetical protein